METTSDNLPLSSTPFILQSNGQAVSAPWGTFIHAVVDQSNVLTNVNGFLGPLVVGEV